MDCCDEILKLTEKEFKTTHINENGDEVFVYHQAGVFIAGYKKKKVDILCEALTTDARLILNMVFNMENIPGYEKYFIVSRVSDKEKDELETTVYFIDNEEISGQEKILILHTIK